MANPYTVKVSKKLVEKLNFQRRLQIAIEKRYKTPTWHEKNRRLFKAIEAAIIEDEKLAQQLVYSEQKELNKYVKSFKIKP